MGEFLEFAAQALDPEQEFARVAQQALPGRGRHHAARMTHEKRGMQRGLEFLDALADRRNRQLALLSRRADAAGLADQDEKIERREV